MKLILTKSEQKRGMIGRNVFQLVAKVECSEQEKEAYYHFRLDKVIFYKSEAEEGGPRQYFGANGGSSLFNRLSFKQDKIEISGLNLFIGITFENESLVHLIDFEEKIKVAANTFCAIVTRSLTFMGEESLDLPLV